MSRIHSVRENPGLKNNRNEPNLETNYCMYKKKPYDLCMIEHATGRIKYEYFTEYIAGKRSSDSPDYYGS